jgi:FAD-dependent urate hydroxylase
MNNLKVVIIGAGIGGLTTAIAMSQAGYEVEIYDRVRELRPAGAGISVWSNGVKVLNSLGLSDNIAKIGGLMAKMQYLSHTGELLNDIDIQPLVEQVGQRPYPVARTDLQQVLLDAFPGEVKLGYKCIGVEEQGDKVTAIFEDGSTATGDLLVAADGIRSILRGYVLGQELHPGYRGYVNWNGLVAASEDLAPKDNWVIYVGEHKRASMMPVADNRFYFFFDLPMSKEKAQELGDIKSDLKLFLKDSFQCWAKPVQQLIQRLDPAETNRVLIHDVGPIDKMVRGRVALLGDSAHATCPDLGQGGCQAMEDGYVLTHYLMTTNIGVKYALQRYETERKERTSAIVLKARKRSDQIHGIDPEVTELWYKQLRDENPSDVTSAIAKVIMGGPMR